MKKDYQQDVKDVIQSFVGQTNVLTIPRTLLRYMEDDLNGGILLSQMLYWTTRTKNEEGWFYKTYADWKEEIGLTEHQVRKVVNKLKEKITDEKVLKALEEKGIEKIIILETKIKKANGNPTVHYRIDFDVLSVSILAFLSNGKEETEDGSLKKRGTKPKETSNDHVKNEVPITETTTKITSETTSKSTHTRGVCADNQGFNFSSEESINKKEQTYGDIASKKLHTSLMEKRKIMTKRTNLTKWSSQINKFIDTSILTTEEFDEVLCWYVIHQGERFVPQIYSASTFCEHFARISDSMIRKNKETEYNGKSKGQIRYEEMHKRFEAKGII